jgi:tetratricopeptide (TPR) repeat protein
VALRALRRVHLRQDDVEAAALAWEAEAAATRAREGAVEAWLAAARLWMDTLHRPERAIDAFERALELDPLSVEAAGGVESLLALRGGAVELAMLNERRGQTHLAGGDRPAAADEFFKAARGWLDAVGDPGRAVAALDRALEAEPEHLGALELRASLAMEREEWAEAADALEARLEAGGDAETLAALHLRLAILYEERLDEPARAVAALSAAVAAAPSAVALDRLVTLHRASGHWTGVVDCLEQLRELDIPGVERARASLRLAEALSEGFDDADRALTEAREAIPVVLAEPDAVDRLAALYERRGRLHQLLPLLDALASGPHPPAAVAAVRVRLAHLYLRGLGDLSRAVAACRTAVELDPRSVEARAALADALSRDPGSSELAVEAHRAVLALDPTRLASVEALFETWDAERLLDRAFCCASVIVFLGGVLPRPNHLHLDWKGRLPIDAHARMDVTARRLLLHPDARNPLLDVLRAVGDHVFKLFPPAFDSLSVDPRNDRLRSDHPIFRSVRLVAETYGVDSFELYQAKRGLMVAVTSSPPSICVGQDVVRRYNSREQRLHRPGGVLDAGAHRAAGPARGGAPADFIGDCVRAVVPDFRGSGDATRGGCVP